jgi:hypothetical protein
MFDICHMSRTDPTEWFILPQNPKRLKITQMFSFTLKPPPGIFGAALISDMNRLRRDVFVSQRFDGR